MKTNLSSYRSIVLGFVAALVIALAPGAIADPIITNVVETGGDNEPTDTITAKWTGVTFPVTIANEPVPGLTVGSMFTVGTFGNHAPSFVDRNHRYTNAAPVPLPAYLAGQEYIMSGNDNRDNVTYRLDVSVSRDVQVYLLIDNRLTDTMNANPPTFDATHMQWVLDEGWEPVITGANRAGSFSAPDEIGIDEGADGTINQYYSIYTKRFPAGTFQLKQADNAGQNMYGVVVAPASATLPNVAQVGGNKIGTVTDNGGGSFTVVGGGNDIWDGRDEFTFAYTELTGDFDVQVRVESLSPTARWSKAGLMARESLSEFSRMAFLRVTPPDVATSSGGNGANDTRFAYRTGLDNSAGESGGQHEDIDAANPIKASNFPDGRLRLTRQGNVITAFNSVDGVTWHLVTSQNTAGWGGGALASKVYLGLAVSRHSGGPTATAEFREFQFNYGADFSLRSASSRGNPNGIVVEFSKPPAANAFNPANYTVDGGVTVSDVLQGPALTSVRLVTSALTEGTTYSVTAAGVQAADGTALTGGTATFVHGAGYETRAIRVSHNKTSDSGYYRFSDAVAKGIGDVVHTGGGVFPPVQGNTLFEDPVPDAGSIERFSSRISGVLNITTSGNYTFYMSSDDAGFLYLSSTDDPANKVQIAREPAWNGRREYIAGGNQASRGTPPANISNPIALQAGKQYYLELVFSEGGGGNNGSATWLPPGGSPVVNGSLPIPDTAFTPSRLVDGEVFFNLGPVQITRNPADTIVPAPASAIFSVDVEGTAGYRFQWQRKAPGGATFADIPGANGRIYTQSTTDVAADNGAQYRVVVRNEFSVAVSTPATLTVRVISCGFLTFEAYDTATTPGTAVSLLTSHPNFPNNPRETLFMGGFDTRTVYPDDSHEQYGARISGWFIAPSSGNWIFYLRSDDASELWLNPNGADPAGKRLIAQETMCCAPFGTVRGTTPDTFSTPVALTAGQFYYVEVLLKEGGGGDYAQVAAKLDTDPTAPATLRPISGSNLATLADPTGASITVTRQPCDNSICTALPGFPTPPGAGSTLSAQDFNSNDGGCTVVNVNDPFEGPWTYNSGAGTWSTAGQGPELGRAPSTQLTCPPVTVTQPGNVKLSFSHRYSFEGGQWDGGQVQVSVNGGAFVAVSGSAFTQNGYNGSLRGDTQAALRGQAGFVETSPGYATPAFVTSVAELGCFTAGDTIAVRFVAAYDTNTRQGNPAWEVDSVSLTEGASGGQLAVLSVAATGTTPANPNPPVFIQWQRDSGAGFADIPGGTGNTYAFAPALADNGSCYRAVIYIPGAVTTSQVACVTVVQPNTPPSFTLNPPACSPEDSGPQTVPNVAANISPHSIVRTPIAFASDFSSQPPGTRILDPNGATRPNPRVEDGVLKLTDANDPGGFGGFAIGPFAVQQFESISGTWKSRVGGGGGGGADGYSLNIADDLADNFTAEEGTGTGLSVTVDTFDNGGGEVGIEIKWRGAQVAFQAIPKDNDGSGNYLRKDQFVDASLNVTPTGLATFTYDGNTISAQLSGYAGIRANQVNLAARTGGANDNHWIDNLQLSGLPVDASSAELGQTVSFEVSNNNPSLFTAQPAISPDGTLTYAAAPGACGNATVTVVARDSGGTSALCGGSDTSASRTFVLCVDCVNDCPTASPLTLSTGAGMSVNFQLPASDPDGDALQYNITQAPAHGVVVLQVQTGAGTYTPNAGYFGPDSFGFAVTDGGCMSQPAVVNINILNECPVATGQSVSLDQDSSINLQLAASDADGHPLQYTVTQAPAHGVIVLQVQTGAATYTPNAGYCGPDSFKFKVNDGFCDSAEATVSITVNCLNQCPTAVATVSPNTQLFPGQTNPIVIAVNNVNACVVLDGTGSTDPDGDALTYTWIPSGFQVSLDPSQEPGGGGTGSGSGSITLSGNTLTINLSFSGLSANAAAAHIHGPAGPGTNAGVLYPLNALTTLGATEGTISGTVTLVEGTGGFTIAQQLQQLCSGLWYVNIHTPNHPGGEIRGQIDPGTLTGATVETCLGLGSHDIVLCVSDGKCATTTTLSVDVITPCEAEGVLILLVQNSTLHRNRQRPLIASIKAACASFDEGSLESGVNQLQALQNKAQAQIAPIDPVLAQQLIDTAQAIIDAVNAASGP